MLTSTVRLSGSVVTVFYWFHVLNPYNLSITVSLKKLLWDILKKYVSFSKYFDKRLQFLIKKWKPKALKIQLKFL